MKGFTARHPDIGSPEDRPRESGPIGVKRSTSTLRGITGAESATTSVVHFLFVPITMGLAWWPSCTPAGTGEVPRSCAG